MRTDAPYEELRPLLFSIAYRMISSVSEAEDIVQESFLRIHRVESEGTKIESPKAYLTSVVTRLSIDHLKSARVRRERYVGQWLPEPLLADSAPDAAAHAETADSLSMAFLVLLESLTPVERAVFLLREVFDYEYAEIAKIVDRSEDNCRQLYVRAGDMLTRGDLASKRRANSATSLRAGFSPRRRKATPRHWSNCWPPTWSSTATVAGRPRRGHGPSMGATAWPASWREPSRRRRDSVCRFA
jgi:RNA polymerase sigma factor (sigma-70 family)